MLSPCRPMSRRSGSCASMRLPGTKSTHSIPTAHLEVRSMCSHTTGSTRFTHLTSFKSPSRLAGAPSPIGTIPNSAWLPGIGTKTEHGATRRITAGILPAVQTLRSHCATSFHMRFRIGVSRPAAIGRWRAPILLTGKAIPISRVSSQERAMRFTRNGSWSICRLKSR